MTVVTDAERLVRDVHPAEVLMADGELLRGVRAFVTSRRLLIFTARPDGSIERPRRLAVEQPCSVPASRGTLVGSLECRLADGSTVWINRGRGCGCGSPLKALAPPVPWNPDESR